MPLPDLAHGPLVAVVGCGRWGRCIVRDLIELGCGVVGVDVSAEARDRVAAAGASSVVGDLAECPSQVDGVVVSAPTRLHARLAEQALECGVPVFVEKPLTDHVKSAQRLASLGAGRLFVMHKWHYHPGVEMLASMASDGRLGDVLGVTSERFGPANPSEDTDILWLLGPHEITIGARVHGTFPDKSEGVVDVGTSGLRGADVISRWRDGRWHRWSISTRPEKTRRRVIVHGARAYAILNGPFEPHIEVIHVRRREATHETVPIPPDQPLLRELRIFRDHLTGGPPPPTTVADGVHAVRTIAEVRRSAGLPPVGSIVAPR